KILMCFRTSTVVYFFYGYFLMRLTKQPHQVVSVPVLGIIFYHKKLTLDIILEVYICFRPRTGDYFLSKDAMIHMGIDFVHEFPSPYWGLFFIPTLYYYDNYGF
uniref:hypothetical protein n=1 Tax=Veillonella sp. CNR 79/14 TaxID=2490954 RepID=UPI00198136C7